MNALQATFPKPTKIPVIGSITSLLRACLRFFRQVVQRRSRPGGNGPGMEGAGKPVPRKPGPTHHLQVAIALPPSDKSFIYPKD